MATFAQQSCWCRTIWRLTRLVTILPVFFIVAVGACETVPVFEVSGTDARIKVVCKQAPKAGIEVLAERLLPYDTSVIETFFTRTSDRQGLVQFSNLKVGGRYEISVRRTTPTGRVFELASLYLRIVERRSPGFSEFILEVPEEPHVPPLRSLHGTVVDLTGEGLQDADVEVTAVGAHPRQVWRTKTDGHGGFSVPIPDGQYDVSFTAPGFALALLTLVVTSDSRVDTWYGLRLTMHVGREGGYKPYNYSIAEDK